MQIQPAALGAASSRPLRDTGGARIAEALSRPQRKAIEAAWKSEVSREASEARASPTFDAQEARKRQAKAKLEQVREWLKIVRKLYAQNPEAMARALAQAVKDLKSAVKSYAEAGGREMGMAGGAVDGALATGPKPEGGKAQPPTHADSAGSTETPGEPGPQTGATNAGPAEPKPSGDQPGTVSAVDDGATDREAAAAARGRALYDAVLGEVRKSIGEDGLDFIKQVRAMARAIGDLLASARIQAALRKDKATEEAFEDADKAMKELGEAMDDMDRDIRQAAPSAGMTLSVAA